MWPASGTWGSLPPVMVFAGMAWLSSPSWSHVVVQVALTVAASVGCIRHGGKVERATGRKDPGLVVIDEVAGMALTLAIMVPLVVWLDGRGSTFLQPLPTSLAAWLAAGAFVWFRAMDVIKPPPARGLQSLAGGVGVLVDDLVVGPYAAAGCVACLWFFLRHLQPAG